MARQRNIRDNRDLQYDREANREESVCSASRPRIVRSLNSAEINIALI